MLYVLIHWVQPLHNLLQKNNTNLPLFWGFFVAQQQILVDQKRHFGYNSSTVAKQEQEMDAYWFYDNDADEYVRVPAADELA